MAVIKHRPKIGLRAPKTLVPGEKIRGEVVLAAGRPVPVEAVTLTIHGEERVVIGSGDNRRVYRHTIVHLGAELSEPRTLAAGEHELPFHFTLPEDAPATMDFGSASVEYTANVRVDIDWWPDAKADFVFNVGSVPEDVIAPRPRVYRNEERGAKRLELSLASEVVSRKGGIDVSVGVYEGHPFHEIRLALVAMLGRRDEAGRSRGAPYPAGRYVVSLPVHKAEQGIPVHIALPAAPVSSRARLFDVAWFLEVVGAVRWGADVTMRIPFEIRPAPPLAGGKRLVPPPVGSSRLRRVFETIATRAGLGFDGQSIGGTLEGTTVEIALGQWDDAPAVLGRLRWPHLQLGLDGGEVTGLRRFVGRGGPGVDLLPDRKDVYLATRDHGQGQALLAALGPDFAALRLLDIDDEGAEFCETRYDGEEVEVFCRRIVSTAHRVAAARAAIPPPSAAVAHEARWRAAADAAGGELEMARMAIHVSHGTDEGAVITEWASGPAPLRTVVEVAVETPIDDDYHFASQRRREGLADGEATRLHSDARTLLDAIGQRVDHVAIEAHALTAHMEPVLADPGPALELLTKLTTLLALLRGATGPYR